MSAKIAVQLYSVRNELERDYAGTINRLASFGYAGVEFAGCPFGLALELCRKVVKDAGLEVPSAHTPVPVGPNRNMIFDSVNSLGCKYLVTGKGEQDFKTVDAIKRSCEEFNVAAADAAKHGLKLAIHNHWAEFELVNGIPAYQIMLEQLSPLVLFELDTYWVKVGGQDPAMVLGELGSRVPLVHIKDGSGVPGNFNMKAAGQGVMDFKPIFARAKNAEWLVSELDSCETDMLVALQESHGYIARNQ